MKECPKCKKTFERNLNFCTSCGARLGMYIEPKKAKSTTTMATAHAGITFAGFWIRLFAYILDCIILFVLTGFLVSVMQNPLPAFLTPLYFIIAIGSFGKTLGMKLLRIRVCTLESNEPIGLGKSFIRFLGFMFSVMIFGLGLLWIAIDKKKQGWHDKIANSIVIYD